MKTVDSTYYYENQGVRLSGKCADKSIGTVENRSSHNELSWERKNALRCRVAYDNVYGKKPIFRRKLIEKYSTARYNFNTKRIYSVQTISKKKYDDSSCSSSRRYSKIPKHRVNSPVAVQNFSSHIPAHSPIDTEKSVSSNRQDTIVNPTDSGVTATKADESSVSTPDEVDVKLGQKRVPSQRTSDRSKNEKASKNVSTRPEHKSSSSVDARCGASKSESTRPTRSSKAAKNGVVRSDLRSSILSRVNPTESSDSPTDSRQSKNLETAGSSFSDSEYSDSQESTYLTISYDGDSDSRFSLISDEDFESYDSPKSENTVALTSPRQLDSNSAPKADIEDVEKSTAKQPTASVTAKSAESHFSAKRANTNAAGLKLSDSDSDSGLQLCSSDGEKSSTDQLQFGYPKGDFSAVLDESVAKLCKHLLSLKHTNDWVNNSSQNAGQLKLNSGSSSRVSSARIRCTNEAGEHPSEPNAVSPSADAVSNLTIVAVSSLDKRAKRRDGSVATCSKPIIGSDERRLDGSDAEQLAEKVTESCDTPAKSSCEETDDRSNVCDENPRLDSASSNPAEAAASSKCVKSIEKWKLVPSTIYQHLAEHYELQKKDTQTSATPKRKRKKGTWSTRRSFHAKKAPEEPVQLPYRDPYADILKELEVKKETIDEPSTENVGMILHVGVNRPLFPEVYRNIIALNEQTDGQITDLWANFALTTLITDKSSERFRSVFMPVIDTQLKSTIAEYQQKSGCKFQEVDLQKVTFRVAPEQPIVDGPPSEKVRKKRRKCNSLDDSNVKVPSTEIKSKSTIVSPQKTGSKVQEVDQKVTSGVTPEPCIVEAPPRRNARKRKSRQLYGFDDSDWEVLPPEIAESSSKKRKTQKSTELPSDKVECPAVPVSALDTAPKSESTEHVDHLDDNSLAAVENSSLDVKDWWTDEQSAAQSAETTDDKVSDEVLLEQHGYKPCLVLVPKIPALSTAGAEDEEAEDNEHHFFGVEHCSRTYGQMFDYRSRNLSLVFFHRIKRILRLQRQNNKLFHSCCYVRLRSDVDDELEEVEVLDDRPHTDSEPVAAEITKNPLDILRTWRLNAFEAPLLKGIDVNAGKFPIRFINHQLLQSGIDANWFVLQLNRCLLDVRHQSKDQLPVELLFQIVCRADLTKKIVCHAIGAEFDAGALNFGVYGVPGLCEAVLVGPYGAADVEHELTATVQLWNGETACIPVAESGFNADSFFLWNEDTKVRSACGLWWRPGEYVPCTSAANSAFMNHLFSPTEREASAERSVKVQSLLMQHPCLTYRKYDRGSHDVNIRLIHQTTRPNTASGSKVSERMATQERIVGDSPLLQPTKLRSRTNMPNYCAMVSPKIRIYSEPRSDVKRETRIPTHRVPGRSLSISERLRMNTENERLRRREFAVLRSYLKSTIDASGDMPLISILNKARDTIKSLDKDESQLKRAKRSLFFKRKKLVGKLKTDMRRFDREHPCYRYSIELILNLSKCDRAENLARTSKQSVDSSDPAVAASANSDDARPTEPSAEPSAVESSKQPSVAEASQSPVAESSKPPVAESSKPPSNAGSRKQLSAKKLGFAAASRSSKLKRSRKVNKNLWRRVVESRLEPQQARQQPEQPRQQPEQPRQQPEQPRQQPQQPRQQPQQPRQQPQQPRQQPQQPRQQSQQPLPQPQTQPPISDSPEVSSSSEGVVRAEHSYSKRGVGLRRNGRWGFGGIPRKEYQKLLSTPSSLLVDCDQQATDAAANERDQVAVYLTENDLPVTKLIIQRLKSVNENARHLSPNERRNRIIALIRKIVSETLQAGHPNQDERVLVPRLRLLQRLLEGANIRIRDSSKIRVIDETIEISDDDDQDEFSIESASGAGDADSADEQMSTRRVYVKVSSASAAPANSSPLQHGITLAGAAAPTCDSAEPAPSDEPTVVDEQLSVEQQIVLSADGDQIDIGTYLDTAPSLKASRRQRGPRRLAALKWVNGAVAAEQAERRLEASRRLDAGAKSTRRKPGGGSRRPTNGRGDTSRTNQPPSSSAAKRPSNGGAGDAGSAANRPASRRAAGSETRQAQKLPISEARLLRDMLEAPVPPKARLYARKTFSTPNYRKLIAERRATRDLSAVGPLDGASNDVDPLADVPDAPLSIDDYLEAERLGTPAKRSPIARYKPNILAKGGRAKDPSGRAVRRASLPAQPDVAAEERLRCPSFVPPTELPEPAAEVPAAAEAPAAEEEAVDRPEDAPTEAADDGSSVENGDEEPSTSRRSSMDSATRLAIKSFASVHSFNDNFLNNLDRMLKS